MATYKPHDHYFHKARAQHLPSRAAFKLADLLDRFHLAPQGARVLDLGCAPGGWLAILAPRVGGGGRVAGIDLAACSRVPRQVATIVGDIRDPVVQENARQLLGGPADLVTSDLSPRLSGIRDRDQARAAELLESALATAIAVLRQGGSMIAKLFMGAELKSNVAAFERWFEKVELARTKASRPGSAEIYLIARQFKGRLAQPE